MKLARAATRLEVLQLPLNMLTSPHLMPTSFYNCITVFTHCTLSVRASIDENVFMGDPAKGVCNKHRAIALVKFLVHRKLKAASPKMALDTFSRTNLRSQLFEFSSSPNLKSSNYTRFCSHNEIIARSNTTRS